MFDLIVMNPPYDGNLHLKILESVIPYAEKIINISPIGYALDWPVMLGMKQTPNWKTKSFCMNHIVSCDMLSVNKANELFDIGSFEKLAICIFDNELHDVGMNLWKNDKRKLITVFNKTVKLVHEGKIDNLAAHVKISTIHGHPDRSDEFDVCTPQYDLMKSKKPNDMSENEFKNWHISQNTKFMKYCNFLTRQGQHLYPQWLPFMSDYTKPWTDKMYCDYFNITGYISDTEAVHGSEWETILTTMKQYV